MKSFAIVFLAGVALAQQSAPSAATQLPIKPGEWKLTAVIHAKDGDVTRSFFSCMTQTDLAHLVPQPANLPKNLSCNEDSQQLTDNGVVLVFSCKSPSSTLKNTYVLTRDSDKLVTGTMKMIADVGGAHQESTTNIAYQWQQDECVQSDAARPAPSLNGGATAPATAPAEK